MATHTVQRHRTAIRRRSLSRPVSLALQDEILTREDRILDYGCGYGEDVEYLGAMGFSATGWDPTHRPDGTVDGADVVNLGYVINVIEDLNERIETLRTAFRMAKKVLVVSAQVDYGRDRSVGVTPYADGVLTARETFQKYYRQDELREFLASTLEARPFAASLGIFYIFRDQDVQAAFEARTIEDRGRHESWTRKALDDAVLRILAELTQSLGRLPLEEDCPEQTTSLAALLASENPFSRLAPFMDPLSLIRVQEFQHNDLLVRLAASYFSPGGRLRFSSLSEGQRATVRPLFGTFMQACTEAQVFIEKILDREVVLESCRHWGHGKLTQSALYFHSSLEQTLPLTLRGLVAGARALAAHHIPSEVTLIKIGHSRLGVSFAHYDDFNIVAHPKLLRAVRADLQAYRVFARSYLGAANPPILHRKEVLVDPSHSGRDSFASLTQEEERLGLLGNRDVGTLMGWSKLLAERGVSIEGHRLTLAGHFSASGERFDSDSETGELFEVWEEGTPSSVRHRHRLKRAAFGRTGKPRWFQDDEALQAVAAAAHKSGRLPTPEELPAYAHVLKRLAHFQNWQPVLGHWFDPEAFEKCRGLLRDEWIIRLATGWFAPKSRPTLKDLSESDRADIRSLFTSYHRAYSDAHAALLEMGDSSKVGQALVSWGCGRFRPDKGLYLHVSLERRLPLMVRLLVCLGRFVAKDALPAAINLIRIAPGGDTVKFYEYAAFDEPVPSRLRQSVKVDFRRRKVIARFYEEDERPRLIVRKDDLVGTDYEAYPELAQSHQEGKRLVT